MVTYEGDRDSGCHLQESAAQIFSTALKMLSPFASQLKQDEDVTSGKIATLLSSVWCAENITAHLLNHFDGRADTTNGALTETV